MPNIHFRTIRDFVLLCRELGIAIEKRLSVTHDGHTTPFHSTGKLADLLGEQGVFLLKR